MSTVEAPVEQCIAAIISALDGGASTLQLIRKRKGKKKWKKKQVELERRQEYGEEGLQQALSNAARACRQARDTHRQEFGEAFAFGDEGAAAALGRLQTSLQNQIVGSIQAAAAQEYTVLDTETLKEAVFAMKYNVLRSMDELCHRLTYGTGVDQYAPVQRAEPRQRTSLGNGRSSLSDRGSGHNQDRQQSRASLVPQREPIFQNTTVRRDNEAHDRSSSIWSSTASSCRSASASTLSRESTATSHADFPEVFETADDHHRAGVAPQVVTTGFEPMLSSHSPRSSLTRWSTRPNVVNDHLAHRVPYPDSPMAILDDPEHIWLPLTRPARHNDYHGFCKGAWQTRQSLQEGLSIHMLPNSRGVNIPHWKCKQCQFQAKATSETTSLPDSIYFDDRHAIRYRWTLLAKSHVPAKRIQDHSDLYTFGCIICAAQGSLTSGYQDLRALFDHIASKHKTAMLTPEVLQKTKCIVGGAPDGKEDWDLNVPESGDRNWTNVAGKFAVMALTGIR